MGRDRKGGKHPLPPTLSRAALAKRFQAPGAKYKNFSLLEEPEPFSLSPSLLAGGGGPAPAPPVASAPPAPAFGAPFSGFGDLARTLQEVERPPAVGGGGGGGGGGGAWDFSAFGAEATSAMLVAPLAPPPPPAAPPPLLLLRERAVADSLTRAHESQASALAERIARADLGNKQRSRALRSITVGANYRSRWATKGAKKQQMKKAWGKK